MLKRNKNEWFIFVGVFVISIIIFCTLDIGRLYISLVRVIEPKIQAGPYSINLPKGFARFHHPFKRKYDSGIFIMDNEWNCIAILYINGCVENEIAANIELNYNIIKESTKSINNVKLKYYTIKEKQNPNNTIVVVFEGYCLLLTVPNSKISNSKLNEITLSIINDISKVGQGVRSQH